MKTSPSPISSRDQDYIREAQKHMIGEGVELKATLTATTLPDSVTYLHSLVQRGLADSYNYYDGTFIVSINLTDKSRYPVLQGVDCVQLQYRSEK